MNKKLIQLINEEYNNADNKMDFINKINLLLNQLHPLNHNPVSNVRWIKIEDVKANEYNPNNVATKELALLYTSISHDGYTQPIVTIQEDDKYVIVDGFHRYFVMKTHEQLYRLNNGYVPVTIINKDINDRMASTIRHNRARGRHAITGMSNLVFSMLENGWDDRRICKELGMEKEELVRLKHITGYSKLYENTEYKHAWETHKQLKIKKDWEKEHKERAKI